MAGWHGLFLLCALLVEPRDAVGLIVRSSDSRFVTMLRNGYRRSGTFRREVADIESFGGIVYVERGRCGPASRQLAACLLHTLVRTAQGTRILRIVASDVAEDRWIALVGHELHHAGEALEVPEVVDGASMSARFRTLDPGWNAATLGIFETRAAQLIEVQIAGELRSQR